MFEICLLGYPHGLLVLYQGCCLRRCISPTRYEINIFLEILLEEVVEMICIDAVRSLIYKSLELLKSQRQRDSERQNKSIPILDEGMFSPRSYRIASETRVQHDPGPAT